MNEEERSDSRTGTTVLPLAEGLARLGALVPEEAMELLRRSTMYESPAAEVLFVRALGREPAAGSAAVIVVEGELETPALVLRSDRLFAAESTRTTVTYVFTDEVRCEVASTVPDMLAIFARGLVARRLACINGDDSGAHVFRHLAAPVVISGNGSGCASLARDAVLRAERVCGYVAAADGEANAAETCGAEVVEGLGTLWPEVADELEEREAWELVQEHLDAGTLPF